MWIESLKLITPTDVDLAINGISKLSVACLITDNSRGPYASKIIRTNDAFADMCGYQTAELIGTSTKVLQGKDTDVAGLCQFRNELDSIGHSLVTVVNYRQDGTPYEVTLVGSRIQPLIKTDEKPEAAFVCFAYYVSDAKLCLTQIPAKQLN